jgi:K+-transporting ATPase KdpF subunit
VTGVVLADTTDTWIGLVLAAALLVYLVVALVFPEKF